ncbi:ead/Ea22-like family protein [Klebsiella oxytoca]
MTDITKLAQRNELLIANGQQTADLLRHLADNEIDSDYFAVVSECESYGKETDAELSITEFALRAAGYVDELVEALEKAQHEAAVDWEAAASLSVENQEMKRRIAELEDAEQKLCAANVTLDARAELAERQLAEMVSRTVTVKLPDEVDVLLNHLEDVLPFEVFQLIDAHKWNAVSRLSAAGIKWEAE